MIRGIKKFALSALRLAVTCGFGLSKFTVLYAEHSQSPSSQTPSLVETRPLLPSERQVVSPISGVFDLGDLLLIQSKIFVQNLTSSQAQNQDLLNIFNASAPKDYIRIMDRYNYHQENPENSKIDRLPEIYANLTKQTSNTAQNRLKESTPLYQRFRSGFAFNFDLSNKLLPTRESSQSWTNDDTSRSSVKRSSPSLRYGLVIQDITPQKASDQASLHTYEELSDMKKARVSYTIGRIDSETGSENATKQIRVDPMHDDGLDSIPSDTHLFQSGTNSKTASTARVFERLKLPRPSFGVKAEPGIDPGNSLNGEQVNPKGLSGSLIIEQKDGLYRHRRIIGQNSLEPEKAERYATHEFMIPTFGALSVGRSYNSNRRLISTSLYGILVLDNLPQVNVHHHELDETYKAELILNHDHKYTLKCSLDMRKGWTPGQPIRQEGDVVTVEYSRLL